MPQFYAYRGTDDPNAPGIHLKFGEDIITGEKELASRYGSVSSLERDLLSIAAAVFAADRGSERGEREDFARRIELSIPVVRIGILQPVKLEIERALRLLSNDSWKIEFREEQGQITKATVKGAAEGTVLLFSGGLDSLAGAVQFGNAGPMTLVSHITKSHQTNNTQRILVEMLAERGTTLLHHQFFVSSRDVAGFNHDAESSQRTRSFMFLILAAIVACREGRRRILMIAENGQMAIHLPLNSARIGAFSTHTAHPDVLDAMQKILSVVLGVPLVLHNPYVFMTKAEVIGPIWSKLPAAIPVANSCWKSARLPEGVTHCGECIPCFIRHIAIRMHGDDPTSYERNPFKEKFAAMEPSDEARRNLADLCEFVKQFQTLSDTEILDEWPELYSANVDAPQTISMYRRAADQASVVLKKYPGIAPALQ